MLTGQAKVDYQREYMRKRRASGLIRSSVGLTEKAGSNTRYNTGSNIYSKGSTITLKPKEQSYNPMMIGYVRPGVKL